MNTKPVSIPMWAIKKFEVLGHQCADTGACHHQCKKTCFRKECCGPLTAATWLNEDWSLKERAEVDI